MPMDRSSLSLSHSSTEVAKSCGIFFDVGVQITRYRGSSFCKAHEDGEKKGQTFFAIDKCSTNLFCYNLLDTEGLHLTNNYIKMERYYLSNIMSK